MFENSKSAEHIMETAYVFIPQFMAKQIYYFCQEGYGIACVYLFENKIISSYSEILRTFLGNVDNRPRHRRLNFVGVQRNFDLLNFQRSLAERLWS